MAPGTFARVGREPVMDLDDLVHRAAPPPVRRSPLRVRLRNYFLTGIVVAAPVGITIYLTWTFVHWVDRQVKPLIPSIYSPDNYLPFSVPGVGLIFAMLVLTLLGFLTANFVGRSIVSYGEGLLDRVPLVRNLYRGTAAAFPDGAVAYQPLVPGSGVDRISRARASGASASSRPTRRARSARDCRTRR